MTQSPFVVGAEVVVVSGTWGRHLSPKRKVAKVHKNGNFLLEGSDRQYRPNKTNWNGIYTADRTGRHNFYSEHVELWDEEKHGAELAQRAKERDVANTVGAFELWLKGKRSGDGRYHLTDAQIASLKAFLLENAEVLEKVLPPPVDEKLAKQTTP